MSLIVNVDFDVFEHNALKVDFSGKRKNVFIMLNVDDNSLMHAIEKFDNNKWVVGFNYVGSGDIRNLGLYMPKHTPILYHVHDIDDTSKLDELLKITPDNIRVIVKVDKSFNDMRIVKEYCQLNKNVFFSGGTFIRLEGVRLGQFVPDDFFRKPPASSYALTLTESDSENGYTLVALDSLEDYEFVYEDNVEIEKVKILKPKKIVVPKEPKQHIEKASKTPVEKVQSTNRKKISSSILASALLDSERGSGW